MKTYRITITPIAPLTDEPTETVIVCDSKYTLAPDLAEWVATEIDPGASVSTRPLVVDHSNCLDPANEIHAIDCPSNPRYQAACVQCQAGNHDDCRDGGLSALPYDCGCALRRHE